MKDYNAWNATGQINGLSSQLNQGYPTLANISAKVKPVFRNHPFRTQISPSNTSISMGFKKAPRQGPLKHFPSNGL